MEENEEKKIEMEKKEETKETIKKGKTPVKKVTATSKNKEERTEKPKKEETKSEEKLKQSKTEKKIEKEVKQEVNNDDLTFKKVSINGNGKKKIDEMQNKGKKNHGVAKAILILVMIFIAAYCVFFVRNLIILNSIANKVQDYENITGYSYTTIGKNDGEVVETKIQFYKNNNVERFDYQRDELNLIFWYDSNTNEKIVSSPASRKATISNAEDFEVVHLPIESSLQSKETIAYMSLISLIYSDQYNSKDCYVIDIGNNNKTWIDKETGLVVKRESDMGTTEYTDINLDYQGEVYKPDLTGYEIEYDASVEQ